MMKLKFIGMKECTIFVVATLLLLSTNVFAEISCTLEGITVSVSEGGMVKAENTTKNKLKYSFTYTTEGTDGNGTFVSTKDETYEDGLLQAEQKRDLFTVPQDPKKKITYKITSCQIQNVQKVE